MSHNTVMPGAQPYFHRGGATGVLCLHGFTASPHEVLWLGQHLAGCGHTVYAPRIAGHGTRPEDLVRSRWEDWLASALDAYGVLRACCDRVIVSGLSMGGALALLLAAELATSAMPVDGVAALAAPVMTFGALQPERLRRLKRIRPYSHHPGPAEFETYIRQQQAARGEPVLGRVRYTRWPTAAVEQLARLLRVVQVRLPEVAAPALLIYSEKDLTVAPDHLALARERLGSRQVEALLLTQSGHILTQDIEMPTVFARVADFVEGLAGQPAASLRSAG